MGYFGGICKTKGVSRMSLYWQRLTRLRSEIATIKQKRKKKFKKDQQIMIDFINGLTEYALFEIVYKQIKGLDHLKLVLKPIGDDKLVVTLYRL